MRKAKAEITNWEGSIASHPRIVVSPKNVKELTDIVSNAKNYPSPVRAVGSNCSTTRCAVADRGTLVDMRQMNSILEIGRETVRVQAGALYIDVAERLKEHGLEFYVNVELGNLTIGSAACGGTKDSSVAGEFGQLSSYVCGMKLVTPTGREMVVTEKQQDLLRVMRSSYGLLGIIYEVTLKVRPLHPVTVDRTSFTLAEFTENLPLLTQRDEAMKLYLYPFADKVTVEFRTICEDGKVGRLPARLRNWAYKTATPAFGRLVTKLVPMRGARYYLIDLFSSALQRTTDRLVAGRKLLPSDQIKRFAARSGFSKYTYSTWAFPVDKFPTVLNSYFEFCRTYYRDNGYRCNLFNVAHRIHQDRNAQLSYSFDGPVLTLDPVSTGDEGWEDFLVDYNEFCSRHGGVPLFNQTRAITRDQARNAFGHRLKSFTGLREKVDPNNRFCNQYFMQLLGTSRY